MTEIGLRRAADGDPTATARRMFERVLTGWAMDVLSLRRRGLDRPGYRLGCGMPPAATIGDEAACVTETGQWSD